MNAFALAVAALSLLAALGPLSEPARAAPPEPLDWSRLVDIKGDSWPWGLPVVAADGEDVWVAWVDGHNGSDVVARHSSRGVWSDTVRVHDASMADQSMPWIAADDGVAHVVWADQRDGDYDIYYRHTTPRGWSPELVLSHDTAANERQVWPCVAVEGDQVYVVWSGETSGKYEVCYRHFNGAKWDDESVVSDPILPENKWRPAVAVENDVVHVAWQYTTSDATLQYRRMTRGEWAPAETLFAAAGSDGIDARLRVDGGVPYALYTVDDGSAQGIYLRHRGGLGWSAQEEVGWAGAAGSQVTPMFDVEAGHIYLAYLNKDGLDWFVYFRYFDGAAWSDGTRMHTPPTILYDMSPSLDASGGAVHLVFYYLRDEFYMDFYYTTAEVDTAPPTSDITGLSPYWMNGGDATLGWTASDDYGLRALRVLYRESTDKATWSDLQLYTELPLQPVTSARGTLTVSAPHPNAFFQWETRAVDLGGKVEDPIRPQHASSAYDTAPPTGELVINGGAAYNGSGEPSLYVAFHDQMTEKNWTGTGPVPFKVRYSDDGVFDAEPWEDHAGNRTWTANTQEGTRTVWAQVMDAAGHVSGAFNDTIVVDLTPPVCVVSINGGSEITTDRNVTLYLNSTDAVSGVEAARLSDDGVFDTETWEAPVTQRNWTLTAGDGPKTISYQVRDRVGHLSAVATDTIVLDTVRPTASSTRPAGNATKVDPAAPIVIEFSEPMDRASVEAAFKVTRDGDATPVAGAVSWSSDGRTLTFVPSGPLDKGATYRVTVGPGAHDAAGNPAPGAIDYTFKTAPKEEKSPGPGAAMAVAVLAAAAAVALRPRRGRTGG